MEGSAVAYTGFFGAYGGSQALQFFVVLLKIRRKEMLVVVVFVLSHTLLCSSALSVV